jgi:hypothetical protein
MFYCITQFAWLAPLACYHRNDASTIWDRTMVSLQIADWQYTTGLIEVASPALRADFHCSSYMFEIINS